MTRAATHVITPRVPAALMLGLAAGALVPALFDAVARLGRNIPQSSMRADYAAGVVVASIVAALIWLLPLARSQRVALSWIWLCKIAIVLGFMLLYESYYHELDAFSYFRLAGPHRIGTESFGFGDGTGNMLVMLKPLLAVVPSYHAAKVVFAALGMTAGFVFFAAVRLLNPRAPIAWLYLFTLFPSLLFWSSILGKDPLVLLCVAVYSYGVVRIHTRGGAGALLIALAAIAGAGAIRSWLVPILAAPAIFMIASRRLGVTRALAIFTITSVLAAAFTFNLLIKAQIVPVSALLEAGGALATGGSGNQLPAGITSPAGFLAFLPAGVFTALLRPLPLEVNNPFGALAGLENLVLLVLLVLALARTRRVELSHPVVLWAILVIACWSVPYSVVSYQNLGAAVRFKAQILPIMLGLLVYLARRRTSGGAPVCAA